MTEPTPTDPAVQTQPEGPLMAALGGMGAAIGIIIGVTAVDYCLDGYSADMRCEAPKGHVIDPRDTDTWHRKGAVRWSGWTGGGLT